MTKQGLLFVFLSSLLLPSTGQGQEEIGPLLDEIRSSPRPLSVYSEKIPSFLFISESTLTPIEEEKTEPKEDVETSPSPEEEKDALALQIEDQETRRKTFTARSKLVVNKKKNFYLSRKLFTGENPTQLWVKGRASFIKEKETEDPHKVTFQEEFELWAQRTIKEMIDFFEDFTPENASWSNDSGALRCASLVEGELCFDPSTSLPVAGSRTRIIDGKWILSTKFYVESSEEAIAWPGESQEQTDSETP